MPERHPVWQFFDVLKRQWWLVAAAVVVALAVGAFSTRDARTTYTGEAVVRINPNVVAKPGYPVGDAMLAEVRGGAEYRSLAASETGVPAEELDGIGGYTTGAPQDRLVVTYTSAERAEAAELPAGLAKAAVARARRLSAGEVDRAQKAVQLTEDMLGKTKAAPSVAGDYHNEEEAALLQEQTVYNYEMAALNLRSGLDLALSAYTYDGNSIVKVNAAEQVRRDALVGAAFAGLFLGVALAALREFLARRPWERNA